jgi:predicted lipoprotein with Yx(FWY)xxD motif
MTILEAAIAYAKKGMSVIPVDQKKVPLIKWEPYQKKRASEEEIKSWFKKFPSANIGIVTGEISNLLVVDCDTPASIQQIQEAIPESLVVPCESTPRGGMHFFFSHSPGFSNRARVAEGIDIRTEGGYCAVAPSVNGTGKGWIWVLSLLDADPPCILNSITSLFNSLSLSLYARENQKVTEKDYNNVSQVSQSITNFFTEPGRDDDIFHLANCAVKGNANLEILTQGLKIIARNCEPPFPENEVEIKVKSALQRAMKRERNIAQEVRTWVEMMGTVSQGCNISFTEWHKDNNVLQAGRMAFKRLCDEKDPIIEKIGDKAGQYRIINRDDSEQKWWLDEGKPLSLVIPLGIEKYAKVFPGNIILLEGQKSQGKSTFAIEFSRLNRSLYPGKNVIYQNVEMSDAEIKDRFRHYRDKDIIGMEEWREFLQIIKRTSDWADKIEPDSINIVDYLVEYEKPYILPKFIFDIHKKLKSGICLCVVQRDPFKPYPAGGRAVRDIPRLIISLINHWLRLEDVKSFWETESGNPSGLNIKYKQVAYCQWKADGVWERREEAKYAAFTPTKNYKDFTNKED